MANYDFRSLSPHDFELLCRDLLQARKGFRCVRSRWQLTMVLNNRELASLIWIAVAAAWVLSRRDLRSGIAGIS